MLERLQKIIAHAGIASRRHAEQLILSGQVLVNGRVVRELGTKADPDVDKIEAVGRLIEEKRKPVYLILHKPAEVVSTLADPEHRKTLINFLRGFPERVYPVGNLDYAASGLILLTNDGELTDKMLKSWSNIPQIYHIKVKGRLNLDELDKLGAQTGTIIRVIRQPDSTRGTPPTSWYEAQVAGAKLDVLAVALVKDQHPIEKIKRIGLGPLSLEGIPVGEYVFLSKEQVEALQHPTRPFQFVPHPRPKAPAKSSERPAPTRRPHQHASAPGKAQHFSNPPAAKSDGRPTRYSKLQRRPSTPAGTLDEFDEQDSERPDTPDTRRAPWLTTSRPPVSEHSRDSRELRSPSKSFRPKGPRNFTPSGKPNGQRSSSGKSNRPANASSKFKRPSSRPGTSARPKSRGKFPPRGPRPPR